MERQRGFSAVDLLIVVAIMLGMAAVVIPVAGKSKAHHQVHAIESLVDDLKLACHLHYCHTGRLAFESSTTSISSGHQLSVEQPYDGWQGPYLKHILVPADNPMGGHVYVYDDLRHAYQQGFRILDGPYRGYATGPGNFVRFTEVTPQVAFALDQELDGGEANIDDTEWARTGAVTWVGGNLYVFLLTGS